MNLVSKRRLTCISIGISSVLSGIEYAIILPYAWSYLQEHFPGIHPAMLGGLLASYSLGALFGSPLSCWWSWLYLNTRVLLLILNLFSITGAALYLFPFSPWTLLASRMVSGFGFGCQSAMIVDLSRSLSSEGTGRRAIYLLYLCRQMGLLLGPALCLPLRNIYFHFSGKFLVDTFSSPGVLLFVAFLIQEVVFIMTYHNLTSLREEERLREQLSFNYHRFSVADPPTILVEALDAARAAAASRARLLQYDNYFGEDDVDCMQSLGNESDVMIESAEQFIMSTSESQSVPNRSPAQRNDRSNHSDGQASLKSEHQSLLHVTDKLISESSVYFEPISRLGRLKAYLQELSDEYVRDDTVVLLAIIFTAVTSQRIFETMTILFTKEIYSGMSLINIYIFILIGFQLLLVGLLAQIVRRLIVDRVLLLLGLMLISGSLLCLLLCLPSTKPDNLKLVPYLVLAGIFCLFASPILVLCSSSLLINITAYDKHIMTQELSQLLVTLGSILGPLWGGAIWGHPQVLTAVPLGIVGLITVLYILSFRHMVSSTSEEGYSVCTTLRASSESSSEEKA